jgi:hypothetical protein
MHICWLHTKAILLSTSLDRGRYKVKAGGDMVFWLIGPNSPSMKNTFEMYFKMSINSETKFWVYIRICNVHTSNFVRKGHFYGLCEKDN